MLRKILFPTCSIVGVGSIVAFCWKIHEFPELVAEYKRQAQEFNKQNEKVEKLNWVGTKDLEKQKDALLSLMKEQKCLIKIKSEDTNKKFTNIVISLMPKSLLEAKDLFLKKDLFVKCTISSHVIGSFVGIEKQGNNWSAKIYANPKTIFSIKTLDKLPKNENAQPAQK